MSIGIDYSMGSANVNHETGIHYGVIPARELGEVWYEQSEAWYGDPTCPKCGNEAVEYDDEQHGEFKFEERSSCDYACENCAYVFGSDEAFPDEPRSFYFAGEGIEAEQEADSYASSDDIFITKSPYYTYAGFCSPCAPGAGYLMDSFRPKGETKKQIETVKEIAPLAYGDAFRSHAEAEGYPRVYCFGHDWFERGKAPYPVFSVETGEIIEAKEEQSND